MVRNIAIIPARSGSKRVKDKNIRIFGGKPLLAWSVIHALESGLFEKVYVSTDSDKYADIARQYGAWVPFLRDAHADDFSGVGQVVAYELTRIERFLKCSFDNVGLLQATCPLCPSAIIREVYNDFVQQNADTMGTCFPFSYGNPWWAFRPTENHEADFLLSRSSHVRRIIANSIVQPVQSALRKSLNLRSARHFMVRDTNFMLLLGNMALI